MLAPHWVRLLAAPPSAAFPPSPDARPVALPHPQVGPELEIPGYGCEDHFIEHDTVEHSWVRHACTSSAPTLPAAAGPSPTKTSAAATCPGAPGLPRRPVVCCLLPGGDLPILHTRRSALLSWSAGGTPTALCATSACPSSTAACGTTAGTALHGPQRSTHAPAAQAGAAAARAGAATTAVVFAPAGGRPRLPSWQQPPSPPLQRVPAQPPRAPHPPQAAPCERRQLPVGEAA